MAHLHHLGLSPRAPLSHTAVYLPRPSGSNRAPPKTTEVGGPAESGWGCIPTISSLMSDPPPEYGRTDLGRSSGASQKRCQGGKDPGSQQSADPDGLSSSAGSGKCLTDKQRMDQGAVQLAAYQHLINTRINIQVLIKCFALQGDQSIILVLEMFLVLRVGQTGHHLPGLPLHPLDMVPQNPYVPGVPIDSLHHSIGITSTKDLLFDGVPLGNQHHSRPRQEASSHFPLGPCDRSRAVKIFGLEPKPESEWIHVNVPGRPRTLLLFVWLPQHFLIPRRQPQGIIPGHCAARDIWDCPDALPGQNMSHKRPQAPQGSVSNSFF